MVQVQDCTAEDCVIGVAISATASTPSNLVSIANREVGMLVASASNCKSFSNSQHGVFALGSLDNCHADLNEGIGLFALDTITDSISTRSTDNGIQARIVENSFAGSNAGTGRQGNAQQHQSQPEYWGGIFRHHNFCVPSEIYSRPLPVRFNDSIAGFAMGVQALSRNQRQKLRQGGISA